MANQYVQYGAAVAGAAVLPAAAKAAGSIVSAGVTAFDVSQNLSFAVDSAIGVAGDAASKALDQITTTFTSPDFLASAGLGLIGLAMGSGSARPSLNFPNIAATAAVALNVSQLIKQGQAASNQLTQNRLSKEQTFNAAANINIPRAQSVDAYVNMERNKMTTSILSFPRDISSEYNLQLKLYPFKRLNLSNRSLVSGNPHTVIKFPLPSNMIDAISLAYSEVSLGMIGGAAFEVLARNVGKGQSFLETLDATGKGLISMARDPNSGFGQAVMRKLAGGVIGDAGTTALNLVTGNVPNPHMAVSFQGVNLKRYNFSWRMSPNNVVESKMIEQIILNLQSSSLPGRKTFLLDFPDVIQLNMSPSGLFDFKPMVLDSVVVNYAPSGVPSFFKTDGTSNKRYPTEIELSISLKEIDIHTNTDPRYQQTKLGQAFADLEVNTDKTQALREIEFNRPDSDPPYGPF